MYDEIINNKIMFMVGFYSNPLKRNPVKIRNSHHYCNADKKAKYHWTLVWEGALEDEAKSGELP